eukprot:scaffold86911_cov80-Attheya_sp.AAC.1
MNAESTNPEVNEEPPDDHGVTDGLQAGETESPQAAMMGSTSTASGTRAILFAVGENTVRTKEILITQVRLEFNLKHDKQRFNPRPKNVKLLQIMKSIDPMYQKHFTVTQMKPPRQAQKVTIMSFGFGSFITEWLCTGCWGYGHVQRVDC